MFGGTITMMTAALELVHPSDSLDYRSVRKPVVVSSSVIKDSLPVSDKVRRVLVIDDDKTDFFVIDRMLKQRASDRYIAVHVANLSDAVTALQEDDFDIVLVDFFIGNRQGTELFEEMAGDLDIPVIVLTGSNDSAAEEAALEAGAFDFLDKNALSGPILARSLDFAMKRYETEAEILEKQADLQRARENAEAAHVSKSEFLSHLGGELKTPLNAIMGFAQAMEDDALGVGLPEEYRTYCRTINSSSRHLRALIEDLLDLSETEAESYDARQRRFVRYRTWIVDRAEARRT
jgi:signal transduction histidine kinase